MTSDENRLISVLYKLAKGELNTPVPLSVIIDECNRLKIFDMAEDEYIAWFTQMMSEVGKLKN